MSYELIKIHIAKRGINLELGSKSVFIKLEDLGKLISSLEMARYRLTHE